MERILDLAAYGLARFLMVFFGLLPVKTALVLGDLAGKTVFFFSKKRRVAYINLKNVFGEKLTARRRKIVRVITDISARIS